jgi:hypothetical protein
MKLRKMELLMSQRYWNQQGAKLLEKRRKRRGRNRRRRLKRKTKLCQDRLYLMFLLLNLSGKTLKKESLGNWSFKDLS